MTEQFPEHESDASGPAAGKPSHGGPKGIEPVQQTKWQPGKTNPFYIAIGLICGGGLLLLINQVYVWTMHGDLTDAKLGGFVLIGCGIAGLIAPKLMFATGPTDLAAKAQFDRKIRWLIAIVFICALGYGFYNGSQDSKREAEFKKLHDK